MKHKMIFILIAVLVLSLAFPMSTSAASGITDIPEFNSLEGDGKYIKYADNYHLDRVDPGIFDKVENSMANTIANFFFGIFKEFSYLTCVFFYHCFAFNIVDIFGDQLESIQTALRKVFFDGALFLIVFATSAFYIIKQLLKGNLQNLLSEILKVVAILVISFAVVTESVSFLTFVNTFTKEISVNALGGISGQRVSGNEGLKSYAADAARVLWSGLAHTPWVSLEFGDSSGSSESDANRILRLPKTSKDREELIKDLNGGDKTEGPFNEKIGWDRIFPAFSMALPIIIKCIFYLIIALLQIGFQIMTLFYVILCPAILLLAISPQLGGADLICSWLKKIAETQISILVLTFIIGLVVRFDSLLANWNSVGWLIALWLQVIVIIMLVLNWQKVLMMLSYTSYTIQNPQMALAMRQMRRLGMNMQYPHAIPAAFNGIQQFGSIVGTAGTAVGSAMESGMSGARNGISGVWNSFAESYTGQSNYNNVKQYKPRTPASPPDSPTPSSLENNADQKKTAASDLQSKNKSIDYNKIQKYQKNYRSNEAELQTVSYQASSNSEDLYISNRSAEGANPTETVNYSIRASNYVAAGKTSSEAQQRPRTADYKQSTGKESTSEQAPRKATQQPTKERLNLQQQSPANRKTAVLSDTRQFSPKPIANEFRFDSQRAAGRNSSAGRPSGASMPKPKPVVEQFNFKVHAK